MHRLWVWLLGAAALLAGGAFVFLWTQHFFGQAPLKRFEESRLLHQVVNLRSYAERESLAGFLPPGDAVVSLREEFVQEALDLSLPIRQEFKNGQYEAVLDSAVLRMEDGSASVQLTGHGHRRGDAETPELQVALSVQGYLNAEGIRPEAGTLDLGLVVTDVRSASAGPQALRNWIRPASRYFAGLRAEDWNESRHRIEIPVRVDQAIQLPAIRGEVDIPGGHVPIAVRTSAVTVYERRFAVSLEFAPRGPGQDSIPVDSVFHGESPWTRQLEAMVRQSSRHDVLVNQDALLLERDRLFRRVHDLAQQDTLWRALRESDKDVTAIIPDGYLERLAQHFVDTYLRETDLDVESDIHARIDQEIKGHVLGKEVGAGRVTGTFHVLRLTGRLRPAGKLDLDLEPPDRLVCTVPIDAVTGHARIACDVEWHPAFLTSIVCKGFEVRDTLDGVALPFHAALRGVVRLALADSFLVGRTVVLRDRIHVPAAPTSASAERIRQALLDQDKFGRCGMALDADSTLAHLLRLLHRGVAVRLPASLFPAFRIPVTLVSEYSAGEFRIHARAFDPEFVVRPTYLRLGFQAGLRVIAKANEKALLRTGAPTAQTAALTSGACCSGPAPLRRAPLRSWARRKRGSGPSARSRDPSSSTPGASGACVPPEGRAARPA